MDTYRNLASRLGADYLLLVGGTADTLEDTGALTAMDLSIVGMFVLPTHTMRGEIKAVAMVIDVHDGTPMSIQTAEMDGQTLATAVQVDSERVKLIEKLRDQAAVKIAKDLCK